MIPIIQKSGLRGAGLSINPCTREEEEMKKFFAVLAAVAFAAILAAPAPAAAHGSFDGDMKAAFDVWLDWPTKSEAHFKTKDATTAFVGNLLWTVPTAAVGTAGAVVVGGSVALVHMVLDGVGALFAGK